MSPSDHLQRLVSVETEEGPQSIRMVLLSDVYFPRVNGVSTSIRTFRRELEALGHEVYLIGPDYGAVKALAERLRELQPDVRHIQTPFVAHYAGLRLAERLRLLSA